MRQFRGSDSLTLALARGCSVTDAAREAGISRSAAQRHLTDPEFKEQVAACRREMFNRTTGRLADAMAEAVETLRGLLTSESESIRLRAAATLLEEATRFQDSTELAERVRDIEAYLSWAGDDKNQRASA
jgi:hypothetical protein